MARSYAPRTIRRARVSPARRRGAFESFECQGGRDRGPELILGVPTPSRRSKLLECCCFGDRVFRFERRRALANATGLCDGDAGIFDADATLARYQRAKFVFSPRGEGCSNYREFEALYAGAIPVVDIDAGAGRKAFWATIPHIPVSYPKHFRKWTRVCESNERRCFAPNREAGAELVAATLRDVTPETLRRVAAEVRDRGPFGYDLRKAFWPYWLHALTRHRWRRSSSSQAWRFAFS